tara:strand:- start:1874 stop:2092 length:219 start_codon:yes stop_codon:yes gene_type:complete
VSKTYYILAIDYGSGYGVEFGAYDKQDVLEEREYQEDNHDYSTNSIRVIKTVDDQKTIDKEINKLNTNGHIN